MAFEEASSSRQRPMYSIFTHSVGAHLAGHSLPDKLRAIAAAGFEGVEIFQDDLDAYAESEEFNILYRTLTPPASPHYARREPLAVNDGNDVKEKSANSQSSTSKPTEIPKTAWNAHGPCTPYEAQREIVCASHVAGICASLGMKVLSLQPMRDVEGWKSSDKQKQAIERVRSRFAVMRALQTDLLLCCSNCQPSEELIEDHEEMASVFRMLADEARQYGTSTQNIPSPSSMPPLRIAFEGLSWGTRIDTWSQAYDVVRRVDRENFGLCLDSFNTLGREFADPCSISGVQEPREETQARLTRSLRDIKTTIDVRKLFFLQIGDARKPLNGPLTPSPNAHEQRPSRMIWSRANRLFPGELERGAYLPTLDFVKAALATGYGGPWSIEVFNESLNGQGQHVQHHHAQRAFAGLEWLARNVE